jgi:hypothetical protein
MKRVLNIIERAVREFEMNINMNDSLQDIFDEAQNIIEDNVAYDYIDECERNRHFDHISWSDGKGFSVEADGEFISKEEDFNTFYRHENGEFNQIPYYDHTDDDYVTVYDVLDTDGNRVRLVAKC